MDIVDFGAETLDYEAAFMDSLSKLGFVQLMNHGVDDLSIR
jgi:hypothetical protein